MEAYIYDQVRTPRGKGKPGSGQRVLGLPPEPRADKNTPFSQLPR